MKGKPLQVLLVEDSAGDARLLREMFSRETPGSFVQTHVERMSGALRNLAKGGMNIVLLDADGVVKVQTRALAKHGPGGGNGILLYRGCYRCNWRRSDY